MTRNANAKHTPTPWHIGLANFDPRWWTIRGPANEAITSMAHWLDADPLNELRADAELIVRAVNAHDALVEALADAFDALLNETFGKADSPWISGVKDKARAALKLAKEGKS